MKNAFIYLLLLISSSVFSQNKKESENSINFTTQITGNLLSNGIWMPKMNENEVIEGSKYLFDNEYDDYIVTDLKGNKFQISNLNYDLVNKQLFTKVSNDSIFIYNLDNLDFITHNNKQYKIYQNEVFLMLFKNNQNTLLKHFFASVQNAVINPMTKEVISPKKYVLHLKYKLITKDKLVVFKLNKKSVLDLFPFDSKDKLLEFVKQKNLSFSKEEDIVSILKFMNE
ncbi:conserved exported hypothetical protein [Flavobacterium sp. 9AF]|uniref:hypothetical protein n=1 Tax=Flavobacterium sp. 9AF TaxID=2653142 RepID=UPI0012F17BB1|nr:hypothetical protein [Flavobacterium sp. 9AF]VXB48423.1 conserved exported hypothetical protein [Flavobacterium sp. 9AF]